MVTTRRPGQLLAIALVLSVAALLVPGCGKKEDAAAAPGYYTGPMKPKAGATSPGDEKPKGGANQAPGSP